MQNVIENKSNKLVLLEINKPNFQNMFNVYVILLTYFNKVSQMRENRTVNIFLKALACSQNIGNGMN